MAPADTTPPPATCEAELARLDRLARREGTVLVADDMQAMRLLLTQTLKDLGFGRIERAADGERAWRILTTKPCDLVLADWNMPSLDGLALLERVRAHPDLRDVVFIIISGEHLDRRVMQAAEESQDAYLTKPVSPEKLTRRLELVLQRRRTQAQAGRMQAQGRPDDAVDVFLAAAANHPRQRWPYFGLGGLLQDLGRLADAERCYERVLELDSEALAALVELGRVREAGGDAPAGRALMRQAIARAPRLLKAYDALAASLEAAGRPAEALAVLDEAMAQQGGGNPARVAARARLQQAAPAAAPSPEPEPAAAPAAAPEDPPEAEDLCALGLRMVAAGRLDEAEEAYGRGLELAPNSGRLRFNLAKLRLRQGREAEALAGLAGAARLGLLRGDWELMVETARQLDGLERRDQAVALLGQVLRRAPEQAEAAELMTELAQKDAGRPAGDGPDLQAEPD